VSHLVTSDEGTLQVGGHAQQVGSWYTVALPWLTARAGRLTARRSGQLVDPPPARLAVATARQMVARERLAGAGRRLAPPGGGLRGVAAWVDWEWEVERI
jgi:hypothetical protein